jgi:hypothetical protein
MGLEILTQPQRFNGFVTFAGGLSSTTGAIGALDDTITTDLEVGALTAASVLVAGTSLQDFAERLLTKTFDPTFTAPSASLSVVINAVTNPSEVEIGTQGITYNASLNRGSINGALVGGIWNPSAFQDNRSGIANNYIIIGVNNGTNTQLVSGDAIVNEGTNTYNATVAYNQGPQPLNSKNQPFSTPLAAGSLTPSRSVSGRRRIFYGADTGTTAPVDSNGVRSLPQNSLNPANGSQYTIANSRALNIPTGSQRVVIAYPASLQSVTLIRYVEAGNANVTGTFTETTVSVAGLNNHQPTNYRVYTYTPSVPFPSPATYEIII